MADPLVELMARARALGRRDRARLVDELLKSLNEGAAARLDRSWATEIAARLELHDRDDRASIDARDVFAKARSIEK
jgi:hypothetical protein